LASQMLPRYRRRKYMTSESNSPDTQKQEDDNKASEAAERKRINHLADEFAKRGKQRQFHYDEGHNIFTK
jgi:hypothetical protein